MPSFPVTGVLSGCGGAGASTLAAVLAGCLPEPRSQGSPRWLIDCDPLGGGIDVLLGCERVPGPRWSQVRLNGGDLAGTALREALPRWHDVSFLAADGPSLGEPAALDQILTAATSLGPVVLDLPRWPSPLQRSALQRCQLIVLVTPAEVRSVTSSAIIAAALDPERAVVVVRGSSRLLPAVRIGEVLGLPVIGELPYDPAVSMPGGLDLKRVRKRTRRLAETVIDAVAKRAVAA